MKYVATVLIAGLMLVVPPEAARGQVFDFERNKRAQTAFKFLNGPMNARAAGLSRAMTAREAGSASLFFNPAGMARQRASFDMALTRTQFIAGIDYNAASSSVRPFEGRYGVLGITLLSVDYGDLQGTVRADNEQGFNDTGTFSPSAWSVGLGYAKALTDRFSIGGHVRYANLDLDVAPVSESGSDGYNYTGNAAGTMVYDFGMFYRTGFRSLTFAARASNFSRDVTFVDENEELPLSLKMGVSMNVLNLTRFASSTHAFRLSVDAESPRDFNERIKIGGEYEFLQTIALRGGYSIPSGERGFSIGAGLHQDIGGVRFAADYAYTDFGMLSGANLVHHIGVRLSI